MSNVQMTVTISGPADEVMRWLGDSPLKDAVDVPVTKPASAPEPAQVPVETPEEPFPAPTPVPGSLLDQGGTSLPLPVPSPRSTRREHDAGQATKRMRVSRGSGFF